MCDNVIIHYLDGTERTCENQFELHQAMVNGLVLESSFDSPYPYTFDPSDEGLLEDGFDWDGCLCSIDLRETARRNGFIYSKKDHTLAGTEWEYDPFDTHFYEVDLPESETKPFGEGWTEEEVWKHEQWSLACVYPDHHLFDRWTTEIADESLSEIMDAIENRAWVKKEETE